VFTGYLKRSQSYLIDLNSLRFGKGGYDLFPLAPFSQERRG